MVAAAEIINWSLVGGAASYDYQEIDEPTWGFRGWWKNELLNRIQIDVGLGLVIQ